MQKNRRTENARNVDLRLVRIFRSPGVVVLDPTVRDRLPPDSRLPLLRVYVVGVERGNLFFLSLLQIGAVDSHRVRLLVAFGENDKIDLRRNFRLLDRSADFRAGNAAVLRIEHVEEDRDQFVPSSSLLVVDRVRIPRFRFLQRRTVRSFGPSFEAVGLLDLLPKRQRQRLHGSVLLKTIDLSCKYEIEKTLFLE